jgi:hypothetical protein
LIYHEGEFHQEGGLMKKKTLLLVVATFLGVMMMGYPALVAADAGPRVGLHIGNVPFSAPITAADAAYLGLWPARLTLPCKILNRPTS